MSDFSDGFSYNDWQNPSTGAAEPLLDDDWIFNDDFQTPAKSLYSPPLGTEHFALDFVQQPLSFPQTSTHADSDTSQGFSREYLFPHLAPHVTITPPAQSQSQLFLPYSHTGSVDDESVGLRTENSIGTNDHGRGLRRVSSAPTARRHSSSKRPDVLRAADKSRLISHEEAGQASGSGTYHPVEREDHALPTPSSSRYLDRNVIAIQEKMRASSAARRRHLPTYVFICL